MDPLTDEELVAVKQLRVRISDVIHELSTFQRHNMSLIRWLRAREFNVDRAEIMLRKCLEWRKEHDVDKLLHINLSGDHETNFPVKMCGRDRRGYPIVLTECGRWDFRRAMESGEKRSFINYVIKIFEQATRICENLTTQDKFISQVVAVIDFEGFQFRQLASKDVIDAICEIVGYFESNYPELLRVAFIINAPAIFQILWAIIKPMLTKRTLAKIHINGGNKEVWKGQIFKIIDPNTFPSDYGGGVNTAIYYKFSYGLDVFPTYDVFPDAEFTTINIKAGQKFPIELTLMEGSQLTWNFSSDQCDIGFSVRFEDTEELVKYCRVDSHAYLQRGSILCQQTGRYTLTFDNTYSSYRGKTVRYAVRQTSPNIIKMSMQNSKFNEANHIASSARQLQIMN